MDVFVESAVRNVFFISPTSLDRKWNGANVETRTNYIRLVKENALF